MSVVWEAQPEGVFQRWAVAERGFPGRDLIRVVADDLEEEEAKRIAASQAQASPEATDE